MVTINKQGYLERRTRSGKHSGNLSTRRTWWFVKYDSRNKPSISIGSLTILVPEELLGERVCFKLVKFEDVKEK